MDLKGVLNEKEEGGKKEKSLKDDDVVRVHKNLYNYVT